MISPTWHSPGCGWLHWRGIGFIWLPVCFFIGRRRRKKTEEEEGWGGVGWVPSSCQRSRLMEKVQNKLFHSDELEIFPVHLQTFAVEVADAESRMHSWIHKPSAGEVIYLCRGVLITLTSGVMSILMSTILTCKQLLHSYETNDKFKHPNSIMLHKQPYTHANTGV